VAVHLTFEDESTVTGRVESGLLGTSWETRVVLDRFRGFLSVQVGDLLLERIDEERD
jgi:hypothetical protein